MDDSQIIEKVSKNSQEIRNIHETLEKHEDKLDELQKQTSVIDKLTYIIGELKDSIDNQKKTNEKTTEILNASLLQLSDKVDKYNIKLDNTNVKLDNTNMELQRLSNQQTDAKDDIGVLNKKVEELSDIGKFDLWDFVKTKFIPCVLTAGVVYLIMNIPK